MVNVEMINKTQQKVYTYPVLARSLDGETVVLFKSNGCGTIVKHHSDTKDGQWCVGDYLECWVDINVGWEILPSSFEIVLSNK